MLRKSDAITAIWSDSLFDRYSLGAYVEQTHIEGNSFLALLDRNIYTDIIAAAQSSAAKPLTQQQKNACALLAFLQLADIDIDPTEAINEYMDSGHHEEAAAELCLFRAVDNLDLRMLIELALGRQNGIPASILEQPAVESIELKKGEDILRWRILYGFALRLAIIERQGGKPVEKFECFLDWIYKEYVFISTAVIFGLIWLSNQRLAGMLKNVGSSDRDKVLRGVRNTTWDMTVAYYWCRHARATKGDGVFWLLCTADKGLKAVARHLFATHERPGELEQKTRLLFCNYLGEKEGGRIHDRFVDMEKKHRSDSSRRAYKLGCPSELYPDIDELEKELLSLCVTARRCTN